MRLTITDVDHAPEELHAQVPIVVDLIRMLPGDDRDDYWLGRAQSPIRWIHENRERMITHVVVAARWHGTQIAPRVQGLPIGIALVVDESLLSDSHLTFAKCNYIAIGTADETGAGESPQRPAGIRCGTIGKFFGTGGA